MTRALLRQAVLALSPRGGEELGRARGAALRLALRLLLRRVHLGELLALLDGGAPPCAGADASAVVASLRRWPATCLHRALAGYAALRARGEPVRLVVGVRPGAGELTAHAWLERDGVPLGEPDDPRRRFTVVLTHPGGAAPPREEPSMAALQPSPDVLLTELQDGTGVLLHLGTKFYFALNCTGVALWKLIAEGAADGPDAVAAALAARFSGAPVERVREDVLALLGELRAEGLVRAEVAAP